MDNITPEKTSHQQLRWTPICQNNSFSTVIDLVILTRGRGAAARGTPRVMSLVFLRTSDPYRSVGRATSGESDRVCVAPVVPVVVIRLAIACCIPPGN